jgi:DNA-directed RNA polymerase alpha subunit
MAQKVSSGIKHAFPTGIAKPALRALRAAGFTNLEQFTKTTDKELLKLHGVGPKAIRLIRAALKELGLSFTKPG